LRRAICTIARRLIGCAEQTRDEAILDPVSRAWKPCNLSLAARYLKSLWEVAPFPLTRSCVIPAHRHRRTPQDRVKELISTPKAADQNAESCLATGALPAMPESRRPRPTPHAPRPTPHAPRPTPHAPRPTPHGPRPRAPGPAPRRPGPRHSGFGGPSAEVSCELVIPAAMTASVSRRLCRRWAEDRWSVMRRSPRRLILAPMAARAVR
jgi:hypothetical protein